eukprot:1202797-Rhodomonas_salina.2
MRAGAGCAERERVPSCRGPRQHFRPPPWPGPPPPHILLCRAQYLQRTRYAVSGILLGIC